MDFKFRFCWFFFVGHSTAKITQNIFNRTVFRHQNDTFNNSLIIVLIHHILNPLAAAYKNVLSEEDFDPSSGFGSTEKLKLNSVFKIKKAKQTS